MRVGEIAALTIGDVINQHGEARPEIKLGAHQTKGTKGRTVILSTRIRREIGAYLKSQPERHLDSPLICSQRNRRAFSSLTLSMLFKEIYEIAGIRTSSHSGRRTFATRLNAKGIGMYASMVFGSLASIFAAAWKYMTKKEEGPETLPLMRLYAFKDQLCKAGSEAELVETEECIDTIFKSELEKHARGDADATNTGALGLAMQQLANAMSQQRSTLANKGAPAPQMSSVT